MRIIKLLVVACFAIHLSVTFAFSQNTANASIENKLVEFNFNLKNGKFSLTDKRDNTICIENAVFQINQFISDQGYTYKWTTKTIKDELGKGKKITIKGAKQDNKITSTFITRVGNTSNFNYK
jgi:hypothetical protein